MCNFAARTGCKRPSVALQLLLLLIGFSLAACGASEGARVVTVSDDRIVLGVIRNPVLYSRIAYMINTDGSGKSPEKSPWKSINKPEWSPDGQWIVFSIAYSKSNRESVIYIMKSNGSYRTRVAHHSSGCWSPTWSPDGAHIAYSACDDDGEKGPPYQKCGLYILNVECVLRQEKCDPIPTFITEEGQDPDWSPDGKRIVFEQDDNTEEYNIYTIETNGMEEPVRLTSNMGRCGNPQWSPSGTKIAFECSGNKNGIFVMDADGSNLVHLNDELTAHFPAWSPDGSKIAFTSASILEGLGRGFGWDAPFTSAVYLMNADGTNITRLSLRDDESVRWFTWYPATFGTEVP